MTGIEQKSKPDLGIYRDFLIEKKAERSRLLRDRDSIQARVAAGKAQAGRLREAREIINVTTTLVQDKTNGVIESLVTKALQSVFGPELRFEIENRVSRNRAEMFLYVVIRGQRHDLRDELGGGVVDIVSFALRIIIWAITSPRSASTIILDEPGRLIGRNRIELFGEMVKEMSRLLDLQFIIITHDDDIISVADRAYAVEQVGGISHVERLV